MRRQSSAKIILVIPVTILLLTSCVTKTEAVSYSQGYDLVGLEAASYYSQHLAENETVELRYNYCYSLFEGESFPDCAEEVIAAIDLYPNYLRFYYLNVLCQEKLGDSDAYKKALDDALQLNPIDKEILLRELEYAKVHKHAAEAMDYAKRILTLDSKNEVAIGYLATNSIFYQYLAELNNPESPAEEASNE